LVDTTHYFDNEVDCWVVDYKLCIGCQHIASQRIFVRVNVANRYARNHELHATAGGNCGSLLLNELYKRGTNRAMANYSDTNLNCGHAFTLLALRP
jgi:hypothetical protein